jgi:hypothetical protein
VFNNGNSTNKGWKTDPVVFLFNEVHARLKLIRAAITIDMPPIHSGLPIANDHPMFSKEHFEYILCHVFYKAREGRKESVDDIPVIWQTKSSERGHYLGKVVLFMFTPQRTYQALPVDTAAADAILAIFRPPAMVYPIRDNFMACLTERKKHTCPFPFVFLTRIYLHLVCTNLNTGLPATSITLTSLTAFLVEEQVNGLPLEYLWQSTQAMKDWIKKVMKILELKDCEGLYPRRGRPDIPRLVWEAALVGMNKNLLLSRLTQVNAGATAVPVHAHRLVYEVLTPVEDHSAADFDFSLQSKGIGTALKETHYTIVTRQLLVQTMTFRRQYMQARIAVAEAQNDRLPRAVLEFRVLAFEDLCYNNGVKSIGVLKNKKEPRTHRSLNGN